ncbi:unnamed protein product [Cuscuta campestris]|uniref:Protein kinase domain-containing protein n=1 Tax=Cuscuta campestris TaxID=132261 RepID=A0A484L0F1_9ASTE|nr:unnamed protein product [Cuscuta campestris]
MNISHWISLLTVLISPPLFCRSQQPYIRKATGCDGASNATGNSTSAFGYLCNGPARSCPAYLTFTSQPPYDSVPSISSLLGADPEILSRINSVPRNATFGSNEVVLVPVTCSCSGRNYQASGSYAIRYEDTFIGIANTVLQGLSTCTALLSQNSRIDPTSLYTGERVFVPLRCACPTKNQSDNGVKYLLSYVIQSGQYVSLISNMFGVDTGETLAANGLSFQDSTIYPNTTLLVPLHDRPSSKQVAAQPPPPPLQPLVPSPSKSSSKTWIYAVAGVLGGISCLSVVGALVFVFCLRKQGEKTDPELVSGGFGVEEKKLDEQAELSYASVSELVKSVKMYTFDELKSVTQDFSHNSCIQGSVYRGKINGDFAAIKKMSGDVPKEINLLSKLNHFNLIGLSGVCFHNGEWHLVFEYAENGPLSDRIHMKSPGNVHSLTWTQRIQIGLDVATGLNYLHSYATPPHVHKNVNSSNILLDRDMRAKITNFGLSRSAEGQEGEFALTRHIVGTKGYMAPEYLEHGLVSPKLDVYAFGVLIFEILTGKDIATLQDGDEKGQKISELLVPVLREENGKECLAGLMDPSLGQRYPADIAASLMRLVDGCVRKDASSRPGMEEIVQHFSKAMTATMVWALSSSTT